MIMGGEIYLPGFEAAWTIGRELGLMVAAHIVAPFGMRPTFDGSPPPASSAPTTCSST